MRGSVRVRRLVQDNEKQVDLEQVLSLASQIGGPSPERLTHHRVRVYRRRLGRRNSLEEVLVDTERLVELSKGLLDKKGLIWVPGSTQRLEASFLVDEHGQPRTTFEPNVKMQDQKPERIGSSDHLPLVTRLVKVA